MLLKAERIVDLLRSSEDLENKDPLIISPRPDLGILKDSGSASIDLRLGTWFVTPRHSRMSNIPMNAKEASQGKLTKINYVPFGQEYFLHPRNFVLGVTLEWLRIPNNIAGYLIGKSSWGRCGLIIATAAGVHPGFKGCLTLELSNCGEVPIPITPGVLICQLFLHRVDVSPSDTNIDKSRFVGQRKPTLGTIELDAFAQKLSTPITP